MPPRSSINKKSKPRKLSTSSNSESSSTVTVRYIKSSTKKKIKSSSDRESPVKSSKKKKGDISAKKVKNIISNGSTVKTTPRKKVIDSSSSSEAPVKNIKKKIIDSSSSSEAPVKTNRVPNRKVTKITIKKKVINTSSSSETPVKINIKKKVIDTSSSSETPVKINIKNEQKKSREDSDTETYLNKILPRELAKIVTDMASEFKGMKTTFKESEKTDKILLDDNNIIYFLDNRIRAHNLINYKVVFDVEHDYNIDGYKGMFKIKNNLVIVQDNGNGTLSIGVHNNKNGIEISSKIVDLVGEVKYLLETPEKVIFKTDTELYVLDPFDADNKLTVMEKGDLEFNLYGEVDSMKKWEKGFYIFDGRSIYIFDSIKLVKKITRDKILADIAVDGDNFYYFSELNDNYYMFKYNITSNISKRYNYGKYPPETNFSVKSGLIFFYGDETVDSAYYGTETNLILKLVDLKDGDNFRDAMTVFIVSGKSSRNSQLLFLDFIDDKVIYKTIVHNNARIIIYDILSREWSFPDIDGDYLGTTSTNKAVFRNDRGELTVLK